MEAELDIQMAKIESKAKEKARMEYDSEKRELKTKMETELAELQAQLKLFQKVTALLSLYFSNLIIFKTMNDLWCDFHLY